MKIKKTITIAILALILSMPGILPNSNAQVFILDDNELANNGRLPSDDDNLLPFIPELDVTTDQYAPLGSGLMVLGCLGGAYLIGKRNKKQK